MMLTIVDRERTCKQLCKSYNLVTDAISTDIIELDNPGEVSQILSGITFDRNNIF